MLVRLRDGSSVVVRRVDPAHEDLPLVGESDHDGHESIGAVDPLTGRRVGAARFHRDPDRPHVAEAAVEVVADWRGRGLGRLLLNHLARWAGSRGIQAVRTVGGDDLEVDPDEAGQRVRSTAERASAS